MQELMCLLGQSMVFEEASEVFKQTMNLEVSAPQIQRLCHHHGTAVDLVIAANCEAIIPELEPQDKDDITYVMLDGSMLYTREDKWREIKLGRVFHGSQVAEIQQSRREIIKSVFVSHLGSVDKFFPKFERYLVPYKNKVIIGDGAKWIWNWAEDNYPEATQILDFYHAKEKLVLFAKHQFNDDNKRLNWIKEQADKLLENGAEQVIQTLQSTRAKTKASKEAKRKAIKYYLEHDDKMQYQTYREKGYMIGSGPIEAAHRSVIQQRMKLSGQKWTINGANAIANLRCYKKSGAWKLIRKIITAAA